MLSMSQDLIFSHWDSLSSTRWIVEALAHTTNGTNGKHEGNLISKIFCCVGVIVASKG